MASKKTTIQVFVYGTLKVGGHFAGNFDSTRESKRSAKLKGFSLYNLGWFPGIVENEAGIVFGELHEYSDPDKVLYTMDRIEGYSATNEKDSLFLRRNATVELEDGTKVEAIIYVFNIIGGMPKNSMMIKDGVWKL